MYIKNEKYKRLYRFFCSIGILLLQMALFWGIWERYYNSRIDQPFALRGNWLMAVMYMLILLLFTHIYGGFKIGYQKPGNLILSQTISLLGTNVITFALIMILSRNHIFEGHLALGMSIPGVPKGSVIGVLPFLVMTLAQILGVAVFAHVLTKIYDRVFPPRKMLLIHGEYEESAVILAA
ncbi:MAG: hypothetical protein J6I64_09120, partial [Lachnospiraceae bacterium]|nr:hypothetical protein [Lachnospiraceae bacterium]